MLKSAEHENVIWVCDGAANVGQVEQATGVLLTNMDKGRMCCTTAVAAGSLRHMEIAEKARKKINYEIIISKYLQKVPTLDIYNGDIKKISEIIIKEAQL
ncbi:MAG: putative zinc-binding protein [Nitrososphaeria archaeon]